MNDRCEECGAELARGASCRELFHHLLLLESRVAAPGHQGALAHFLAVASYGLQHPIGMNFSVEAWVGLQHAVADVLAGKATLEEIRLRARRGAKALGGVTKKPTDPAPVSPTSHWPITVADALSVDESLDDYLRTVREWAGACLRALGHPRA